MRRHSSRAQKPGHDMKRYGDEEPGDEGQSYGDLEFGAWKMDC